MSEDSRKRSIPLGQGRFATTHWSVVQAAGEPNCSDYKTSLETLCKTYWYPLYAYLRRQGYNSDQAGDYTQAFFARLMEKESIKLADRKRGKFRSFLLTSLKNFIADEYDRSQAQKRGGGKNILSLDFETAEGQYSLEPQDNASAEKLFERSWAMTLLKNTLDKLCSEYKSDRKKKQFEHLRVYLTAGAEGESYNDIAEKLSMTEAAVKTAVHRLRRRYRQLLKDEIAQTVSSQERVEEEINELFKALSG